MNAQLVLEAIDPLADAVNWAEENPEAWRAVVDWAKEDRAAGIDPSTRLYCCLLRRPHFARVLGLHRASGSPVLVNDHLSSSLARLLNRRYPELRVPVRAAAIDTWAGG